MNSMRLGQTFDFSGATYETPNRYCMVPSEHLELAVMGYVCHRGCEGLMEPKTL